MAEIIDYIPARAPRRATIRFRVVTTFGALALLCVLMAYATATRPEVPYTASVHSEAIDCNYVDGKGTFDVYKPDYSPQCMIPTIRYKPAPPGTPAEPNGIWFFLAAWPAGFAALIAFLSFLVTGRPW